MAEEIAVVEKRLSTYPTSYPIEELLLKKDILYCRCHIMHRRFRIIYYYDDIDDVVHLIDIWDSKVNPTALIRRIK